MRSRRRNASRLPEDSSEELAALKETLVEALSKLYEATFLLADNGAMRRELKNRAGEDAVDKITTAFSLVQDVARELGEL